MITSLYGRHNMLVDDIKTLINSNQNVLLYNNKQRIKDMLNENINLIKQKK